MESSSLVTPTLLSVYPKPTRPLRTRCPRCLYKGEKTFLGRELATELPPIFIAGTDQPGHIWQQFLERSGLADETGRRTYHIVKMFTRERPIHLTPEGIDVMVKAAEEHPGLVFLLDSYSTLTRPLQLGREQSVVCRPVHRLLRSRRALQRHCHFHSPRWQGRSGQVRNLFVTRHHGTPSSCFSAR